MDLSFLDTIFKARLDSLKSNTAACSAINENTVSLTEKGGAMKILYLVPGPMSRGPMGSSELDRRKGLLQEMAFQGTQVEIQDVPDGPASIESAYDELMAVPATLRGIVQAERNGF